MRVQRKWETLLGADHISVLPKPDRVVDVIFGIMAQQAGKVDYFKEELKDRQLPDKDGKEKVDTVMESLKTVHSPDSTTPGLDPIKLGLDPASPLDVMLQGMHPGADLEKTNGDDG